MISAYNLRVRVGSPVQAILKFQSLSPRPMANMPLPLSNSGDPGGDLEQINRALLASARKAKLERGRVVRRT
jgi:hypothetical protein